MFYITGSIAVLWFVLWFLLTTDEPSSHKWISKSEVNFIEEFRAGKTNANITPPYLEILMSPAVWVIILAEFANSWGLFMILTEGPNFISEVLDQDITKVKNSANFLAVLTNHGFNFRMAFSMLYPP